MIQEWKVGAVRPIGDGYGFAIQNRYGAPLLSAQFETEAEAQKARSAVSKAIENAVDVRSHPVSGRMAGT